jgi:MFS family permease
MEQNNPFISSAIIMGLIFALVASVVSTFMSYNIINSEPSLSTMIMTSVISLVSCLVGAFAGMMAVRHHVKEFNVPMKMGRGAVIGVTTGVFVALFITLISFIWTTLIDPAFTDKLMEAIVASMESMGGGADMSEAIDGIYQQFEKQKTLAGQLQGFAINAGVLGALNVLTGLLGVKFFAPKEENNDTF